MSDITNFHNPGWTDEQLLDFMVNHPILMNRAVVVTPGGTRLCRPSQTVLDIPPAPQRAALAKECGAQVIDEKGHRVAR